MTEDAYVPYTPRARKVLELADDEARSLGHNYVGTEHLLLGLVREGTGVATRVLRDQAPELNTDSVRAAVVRIVGRGDPPVRNE